MFYDVISNNYNIGERNYELAKKRIKVILVNLNWFKSKTNRKTIPGKQIYSIPYSDLEPDGYLLKIINKHENDSLLNVHSVNPNYLKLTEAEEKKLNDKRS